MISRVAENLTWLQRYAERAEATARLLHITAQFGLDLPGLHPWRSVVVVMGEQPRFVERFGWEAQDDADAVLEWLTWSADCPVALHRSVQSARENARVSREAVSREVWEAVNETWLWIDDPATRAAWDDDPALVYERAKAFSQRVRGAALASMLYDEPLWFLELGLFLERAQQTARALDVRHHLVQGDAEGPAETLAWLETLLIAAAYEPFFQRHRSVRGPRVAELLLLDPAFPRSVRCCVDQAVAVLSRLGAPGRDLEDYAAGRELLAMQAHLGSVAVEDVLDRGIHEELTAVVDGLARVSEHLVDELFAPAGSPAPPDAETPS